MANIGDKLRADLAAAQAELAAVLESEKLLRWKVKYISTLLESLPSEPFSLLDAIDPDDEPAGHPSPSLTLHAGMTIADVAAEILRDANRPLSSLNIARRAMELGYAVENIERARSHFSAVISKDVRNPDARFWQMGRGRIGLSQWRSDPRFLAMVEEYN